MGTTGTVVVQWWYFKGGGRGAGGQGYDECAKGSRACSIYYLERAAQAARIGARPSDEFTDERCRTHCPELAEEFCRSELSRGGLSVVRCWGDWGRFWCLCMVVELVSLDLIFKGKRAF